MTKTLCNRQEELKRDFAAYAARVDAPSFVCKKCGRAANRKKYLCKAKKIHKR